MLENIPADEAQRIAHIVELTLKQLERRYPGDKRVLRGVHAKGHGCVTASFTVMHTLAKELRYGVFSEPGKTFPALVRFSNASVSVEEDSKPGANGGPPAHGSRGMAIKLLGVEGPSLGFVHGALTQDFLMINQPVFAFANVEDYEALSEVLLAHGDDPRPFFGRVQDPALSEAARTRAKETGQIVARVRSAGTTGEPPVFQAPPASPVDNAYFGASPFLLGPDQVMRIRACPVCRSDAQPNVSRRDYLKEALVERLRNKQAGAVVFQFEVQVRPASSINPDVDIENASHDWPDSDKNYVQVATLTIPLQELHEPCEDLVFTPWHGLEAHRPLGGINRLRRAVYEASARFRHLPKEPGAK